MPRLPDILNPFFHFRSSFQPASHVPASAAVLRLSVGGHQQHGGRDGRLESAPTDSGKHLRQRQRRRWQLCCCCCCCRVLKNKRKTRKREGYTIEIFIISSAQLLLVHSLLGLWQRYSCSNYMNRRLQMQQYSMTSYPTDMASYAEKVGGGGNVSSPYYDQVTTSR